MNFYTPNSGRFIDLLKYNSDCYGTLDALTLNKSNTQYDYITLNWSQYYSIVTKTSSYLLNSLNFNLTKNNNRHVVAVLSNNSSDYVFYNLSFMQLNIIPLHLSTRVNEASCLHLLEKGKVSGILVSDEFYDKGLALQSKLGHKTELIRMESLDYFDMLDKEFGEREVERIAQFTTYLNQEDELAYYVHSTGSTSLHPKLIPISNRVLFGQTSRALTDSPLYPSKESKLSPLPLYHTGGQLFSLHMPIRWCQHIVAPPNLKGEILSGAMILELINCVKFNIIKWLPKLLIEFIEHCDSIPYSLGWEKIANWGGLSEIGGAALPKEYIDKFLDNGQRFRFYFGSSEVGIFGYSQIVSRLEGCRYIRFPKEFNYYMEVYDEVQGIYELVIKKEESGLFCGDENYKTKDLFKVRSWEPRTVVQYHSRCDDVLVHVTGEKTNPLPMEDILNQSILIKHSAILGKNHTLNHVLLQLNWDQVELIGWDTAMNLINEQISLVNKSCPSHSRLVSSCVHLLDKSQEILVTVKGNIIRQANYNLYKNLIENTDIENFLTPIDPESCLKLIVDIITESLNLTHKVDINSDFFELGMDSLSALVVVKKLQKLFPNFSFNVSQIYKFKTINNIMKYLNETLEINEDSVESIQTRVDSMILKYTQKFCKYTQVEFKEFDKRSVLVIGCNGALACHLIHSLLHREDVDRVIGIMRGNEFEDKSDHIISIMREKGLFIHQKVLNKLQCFSADMFKPSFNLPENIYKDLYNNVTEVTQVGWRMNFLNSLEDFEDCIETTSNLLEFCLENINNPKAFNFVSTIAPAIPTYKNEYNGIIPETPTSGKITSLVGCTGYGLSKLVGEQICYHVAESKSLPVKVFRVGELSGDQALGRWNTKEFLPLLIRTIIKLRSYPNLSTKNIAWVPIDIAGESLADLGRLKSQNAELYTIVNPVQADWSIITNYIENELDIKLERTSLSNFLNLLKTTDKELDLAEGLENFLMDYLKDSGNVSFEVTKSVKYTKFLNNCPPLNHHLASLYFRYWKSINYF